MFAGFAGGEPFWKKGAPLDFHPSAPCCRVTILGNSKYKTFCSQKEMGGTGGRGAGGAGSTRTGFPPPSPGFLLEQP
jgi:hypothetical protein